jgi:hypothetical protein
MNEMSDEEIRAVVAETLAEQQRLHRADIDAVVLKTIVTILTSFGIEEEDRKELRSDFQHLRRWRKSVEQAQSYTFKAVITIIVTGFVGAVWLGHAGQMIRSCVVVAVLLSSVPAQAIPCWMVRRAVAEYGEKAVESWARSKGIPDNEIEKARRCVRQGSTG